MIGAALLLFIAGLYWWAAHVRKPAYQSELDRRRSTGVGIDPKQRDRSTIRRIS